MWADEADFTNLKAILYENGVYGNYQLNTVFAAYKMANVASMLVKRGCEVHVVMTKNATNFINPIAFESLTNTKCLVETFDRNFQFHVAHVSLTDKADAMLIAPASANIIGKIANGIADDMLSTTVMACNKPVIISPAMNTKMYNNPILQDNLDKLRRFGYEIVEPANGHLACGTSGAGKMPSEEVLVAHLERVILLDLIFGGAIHLMIGA